VNCVSRVRARPLFRFFFYRKSKAPKKKEKRKEVGDGTAGVRHEKCDEMKREKRRGKKKEHCSY